jgi:hypothetical protein
MRLLRAASAALGAALLLLPAGCSAGDEAPVATEAERPELGLMGTIPIYWGEADGIGQLLSGEGSAHWARDRLEADYDLEPLDTLNRETLQGLDFLLLAQPRALSGAENVALDQWVREGGHLLLFADPMLTGESRFAIGDRRRPQEVILLSPILSHWGLELQFDMDQPAGLALHDASGVPIPVNLPGTFAATDGESGCTLLADSVVARCKIGAGQVVVLADAALLDLHDPHPAAERALGWLLDESFGVRDFAG